MGQARDVFDRLTDALNSRDLAAVGACFAEDAEAVDPFSSTTRGREQIVESWRAVFEAFPDGAASPERKHESGNTAMDEWTFSGTHSGPLRTPDGEEIPATGRRVTMRGADFATVENGVITSHRVYFDQMELLGQLGLIPEQTRATAS